MWVYLISLVILQVLFLLLSPFFRQRWPFSLYYQHVFKPFIQDKKNYRWKYYSIPAFYVAIYIYIVYCYYAKVEPVLNQFLSSFESILVIPSFVVYTPLFGLMTMLVKPENTSSQSTSSFNRYKYDNIIYYPGTTCETCHKAKPARSKHCGICNRCILLHDHHCIWVNNCIGKGNFAYFFSFLFLNSASLSYAFVRLLHITTSHKNIPRSRDILSMTILCGCFSVICTVFTYLQMTQLREGMTTNEVDKWFTVQEFMREGKLAKSESGDWFFLHSDNNLYSTNAYDQTVYNPHEYQLIHCSSQIPNLYDKHSFWANLVDFCT